MAKQSKQPLELDSLRLEKNGPSISFCGNVLSSMTKTSDSNLHEFTHLLEQWTKSLGIPRSNDCFTIICAGFPPQRFGLQVAARKRAAIPEPFSVGHGQSSDVIRLQLDQSSLPTVYSMSKAAAQALISGGSGTAPQRAASDRPQDHRAGRASAPRPRGWQEPVQGTLYGHHFPFCPLRQSVRYRASSSHKGRREVSKRCRYSPFHPHALSRSRICAGAGATTRTGSLFFEIGITISRECRCRIGSPRRGPLP